jgi:hypothetical protein
MHRRDSLSRRAVCLGAALFSERAGEHSLPPTDAVSMGEK